jgi:hypothetical protein
VGYVSVRGCSGPAQGDYTYDSVATRTVLDVAQGPTEHDRVLSLTVYFTADSGEQQTVTGSLAYQVQ